MKEKIKIFVLLFCGIIFSYILFKSYHFDNIFQIFFYIILGGIGLYIFYNGIFDNVKKYKETKKLQSYILTIIGVFLVLLNLGIFSYYEIKLNSETLIKAENHGVYADFKKNGDYIIKSGSWAGKTHFYGAYSINDSLIKVDRLHFDKVLVTDKFVIRKMENPFDKMDNDKNKAYLIELDKNNKTIKNDYFFEIVVDNRK